LIVLNLIHAATTLAISIPARDIALVTLVNTFDGCYDTLNRLSTAHDNTINGSTTYAYDDVGNLQSFAYPNGTSHTYTYDNLVSVRKSTPSSRAFA
jgi:hypothetical protein